TAAPRRIVLGARCEQILVVGVGLGEDLEVVELVDAELGRRLERLAVPGGLLAFVFVVVLLVVLVPRLALVVVLAVVVAVAAVIELGRRSAKPIGVVRVGVVEIVAGIGGQGEAATATRHVTELGAL